ncbi:hypothetical protein QA601_07100 [Chitinispirillales bacterium ANBcel5]|uniref:hypothetical protein n=1 Tax=Cellulosispirillum alkaliphilum TaxID=3039283 RepID=UPI002A5680E3|nr:hypothetical protein [Chitinispirillales bacterium ANBcel5]
MKNIISLLLIAFTTAISSTTLTPPIAINPVVNEIGDSLRLENRKKVFVGEITNNSSSSDSSIIGYTRTGRRTKSALVSSPQPQEVIQKSLKNAFSSHGIYAPDPSTADFILEATLLEFKLSEEDRFFHQILRSAVKIEFTLTDPYDSTNVRGFTIRNTGERTAFNATKHAETVLQQTIENIIGELINRIDSL